MRILWKVHELKLNVASLRYRCLKVIKLINRDEVKSFIYEKHEVPDFSNAKCIIFIKCFTIHDLALAKLASKKSIPVYIDLCDNIFEETQLRQLGYSPKLNFLKMCRYANKIFTTGPALKDLIHKNLEQAIDITVIPDGLEGTNDIPFYKKSINKWSKKKDSYGSFFQILSVSYLFHYLIKKVKQFPLNSKTENLSSNQLKKSNDHNLINTNLKKVLWFGQAGDSQRPGMNQLVQIKNALENAYSTHKYCLVICSNNKPLYHSIIEPFNLKSQYIEWNPDNLSRELKNSHFVILPNNYNGFSEYKSANRVLTALNAKRLVITDLIPSYQVLSPCLLISNWERTILELLSNKEKYECQLDEFKTIYQKHYNDTALCELWKNALSL